MGTKIQADHQKSVSSHDEACGTYNTYAKETKSTCSNSHFLCGDGAAGAYETCLGAIDCQMHHDMAISVASGASKFATFARQMIPHHQNAVSMAKALLKHHKAVDYPAAGTEYQDMAFAEGLTRGIINVQNRQIQQLSSWLDANAALAKASNKCYDSSSSSDDGLSTGALVGIIVGAIVGLLLIGGGAFMMMQQKKKTVSPK